MQINSIATGAPISFGKLAPLPKLPVADAGDQIQMSLSANAFTSMVKQAGREPEVRNDVVNAYKAVVQSGRYPDSNDLQSLTDLMGSTWFAKADSAQD